MKMKRALALILSFTMILGSITVSAEEMASSETVDGADSWVLLTEDTADGADSGDEVDSNPVDSKDSGPVDSEQNTENSELGTGNDAVGSKDSDLVGSEENTENCELEIGNESGDAVDSKLATGNSVADSSVLATSPSSSSCTVTFNPGNGDGTLVVSATPGKTVKMPKNPVKIGYTFAGWFGEDGSKFTSKTKVAGSIVLTAKWTENAYTLKFNKNGGTAVGEEGAALAKGKKLSYTESFTLPGESAFFRKGYKLAGFCTKSKVTAKGAAAYPLGSDVSKLTAKNKGTVTLYCVWEQIEMKELKICVSGDTSDGSDDSSYLTPGSKLSLAAATNPTNAYGKVTWASSDKKVATVDKNGVVTVKSLKSISSYLASENKKRAKKGEKALAFPLEVEITATCKKSKTDTLTGSYKLVICTSPVKSVSEIQGAGEVLVGGSLALSLRYELDPTSPLYAGDCQELLETLTVWKSSNSKILTVDGKGVVTAKSAGKATVTASVVLSTGEIASRTAQIEVEKDRILVTSTAATLREDGVYDVKVMVGSSLSLMPTYASTGERAKGLKYTYNFKKDGETHSDVDYAGYFLCDYGVLYGFTEGKAEMTITSKDGAATRVDIEVVSAGTMEEVEDESYIPRSSGYYYWDDDGVQWRNGWNSTWTYKLGNGTMVFSAAKMHPKPGYGEYLYKYYDGDTLKLLRIEEEEYKYK